MTWLEPLIVFISVLTSAFFYFARKTALDQVEKAHKDFQQRTQSEIQKEAECEVAATSPDDRARLGNELVERIRRDRASQKR